MSEAMEQMSLLRDNMKRGLWLPFGEGGRGTNEFKYRNRKESMKNRRGRTEMYKLRKEGITHMEW